MSSKIPNDFLGSYCAVLISHKSRHAMLSCFWRVILTLVCKNLVCDRGWLLWVARRLWSKTRCCNSCPGYNVCIFAYGQTGSGKTHTMSGTDVENLEGRGINYRALDDLFALRGSRESEVRTLQIDHYEMNLAKLHLNFSLGNSCSLPGGPEVIQNYFARTRSDRLEEICIKPFLLNWTSDRK